MRQTDLLQEAVGYHRAGRLDEAATLYHQLLQAQPDHFDALRLLGMIALQRGDPQAVALLEQAVLLDPDHASALHLLGLARRARDDFAGAAEAFHRAVQLAPDEVEMQADLADALTVLGRPSEAVPLWKQVVERLPTCARFRCGLGDALHALGRLSEAADEYELAIAQDSGLLRAWWGLGCIRLGFQDHARAADALGQVIALDPNHGPAHQNRATALFGLGQVDPALHALEKALELLGPNGMTLSSIATIIPGSSHADHRTVLQARQRWAALAAPEVPRRPWPQDRSGRPLRLGYVSSFFQDRNWMKPVWCLLNNHDRDRFEIHLFSDAPASSAGASYHQGPGDCFHDVTGLTNAEIARLVEAAAIDILIDLNGYSAFRRLALFALRPAPVQVAWFGLFATSGMGCFDALVGDPHLVLDEEEPFFSEPVVRLPNCWLTFEVGYPVPDIGPAPSLSGEGVTFGCLAPQYKITSEVVGAWARILHGSPSSRLLLKSRALASADNRRFVAGLFARAGVALDRVELDGPADHFAFLSRYNAIDVALDTFPYSGGTTTAEALWQGIPVLCFPGDRWVARISASMMRYAGLADFVAPDLEGYIARAIALANDPATPVRLDRLRQGMRERLRQAPVCDGRGFARNMEDLYLRLWEQGRTGSRPSGCRP